MDFDPWQHFVFLRPLIVFLLACPLLILAVFVGWYKERRDANRNAEAHRMLGAAKDARLRSDERAVPTTQTPEEWRVGLPRANRNRRFV
jgi:hypothetical protein